MDLLEYSFAVPHNGTDYQCSSAGIGSTWGLNRCPAFCIWMPHKQGQIMYFSCPLAGHGTYSEPCSSQWHFEPHAPQWLFEARAPQFLTKQLQSHWHSPSTSLPILDSQILLCMTVSLTVNRLEGEETATWRKTHVMLKKQYSCGQSNTTTVILLFWVKFWQIWVQNQIQRDEIPPKPIFQNFPTTNGGWRNFGQVWTKLCVPL